MEQLVLVVNLRLEFHSVSFRCGLGEEFEFLDPELFLFIRLRFSLFWHRVRVLVRRPARDVRDTERSPAPRAGGHLQRRQWPVARAATAGAHNEILARELHIFFSEPFYIYMLLSCWNNTKTSILLIKKVLLITLI